MSITETIPAQITTGRIHGENELTIMFEALHDETINRAQAAPTHISEGDAQVDEIWDSKEGWKVVMAGACIFFVYLGLVYSYGIVQLHLERRQLANVPTLSFIGSVAVSIIVVTFLRSSRLCRRPFPL